MKILVTGGLGYLGGRICTYLSSLEGHEVIATGRSVAQSQVSKNYREAPLDLLSASRDDLKEILTGVETVVHLAAVNEHVSFAQPDIAERVNVQGTQKILSQAIACGVQRFIYMSTAHVYGKALIKDVDEHSSGAPTHPYATTHIDAEKLVCAAHRSKKIEGIVLRLSNGIGYPERMGVDRWSLVGNDFCKQIVETSKITLQSSGVQLRDFICLLDVARGVEHVMEMQNMQIGEGVFNLGGETPMSIVALAEFVRKIAHQNGYHDIELIKPEAEGRSDQEKPYLHYSIERLKDTGFELKGVLSHEVLQTLKQCQAHFGTER